TARVARREVQVGLDPRAPTTIDRTDRADDPRRQRPTNTEWVPDGDHERADPDGVGLGERRGRHAAPGSAQQREIRVRVTRQDTLAQASAVREPQGYF